jgi:hypothetical protein
MRKAWMISTACGAVLALSGMAAAQGMNEHGSADKNAPAATQGAPSHSNQMAPSGAGRAQNMERGHGRETTGQGMSEQPKSSTQENGKAGSKASGQLQEKSRSNFKEQNEKSGSNMKEERNEKSGSAMGREQNTRTGANQNDQKGRATTGAASTRETKLTTEERTKIRNVVVNEHKIPRLTKVNFNIRVGVRVPRTVHFVAVPEEIIAIHPAWRAYRVIYVNDELVLIDPATFEIVDVVVV